MDGHSLCAATEDEEEEERQQHTCNEGEEGGKHVSCTHTREDGLPLSLPFLPRRSGGLHVRDSTPWSFLETERFGPTLW